MKTYLLLSGVIVAVALLAAEAKRLPYRRSCWSDSDCRRNQCCIIKNGPPIMSKRLASGIARPSGVCRNYLRLNDNCAGASKMFGSCGCGPGLYCRHYPDVKLPVGKRDVQGWEEKRKIIAQGRYVCKIKKHLLPFS
ncbi:uncharacterized protein LOC121367828 [Gigantopelta aegis]|uniref:uncharacterized protein LOC121367828 n=1 Tax=Gigantopelta aegis TaxID=1735272 RepID=UPI001B887C29|nr:uncharacterized protein LOC121367828 [Gigantopelta aegis]